MTQSSLDQAIEYACRLLPGANEDARNLPEPMRTVALVHAAQGIIDNGGLEYFFEMDFPLNPPYSTFVDVFLEIGADAVAECIEASARMFPFPHPHLYEAQRQAWLVSIQENAKHEFARLSYRACGDKVVWEKLTEYVDRNRAAFGTTVTAED